MIQLQALSLQLGTKTLIDTSDLTIYPGQKIGVIGANGSGKTSLFKLLLGEFQPDAGSLAIPKHWRLAHMAQEVGSSDRSALDYVLDGDEEYRQLEDSIASCADGEQLARLYSAMEAVDGYSAGARAGRLLYGLGFAVGDETRSVRDFSGGWRIRLNLAKALMCRSDLLLLDEPTNHLDLDATFWLEDWLQAYKGTLLIISHDRDFLDNVVQGIVSFEASKLFNYTGNYSSFERQKAERLSQQALAFDKQQLRIGEIENFVRRFRAKASKAKQAQSRLKELERMEKLAPAHIDSPFKFRFPEPEKIPQTLLTLDSAAIGYAQNPILRGLNLSLFGTSRIGLLGHNGAGKSSLIKTIAGNLPLLAGERIEGAHLRLGYFAQHQLEALDMDASAALHLLRITPKASEQQVRNFLGGFGFQGDRAFELIRHFSGGEKARLALAIIAWQKPNLLLLDEPTNHLDLEVREALTLALLAFEGAVIIVSHDRHLLRNTVDEFLLVANGKAEPFAGDLEDYHEWLLQDKKNRDLEAPATLGDAPSIKIDKKETRQNAALKREKLKPFTQAIRVLEQKMDKLQKQLGELDAKLADPDLYVREAAQAQTYLREQGQLRQTLGQIEEEWLEKTDTLEQLSRDLD